MMSDADLDYQIASEDRELAAEYQWLETRKEELLRDAGTILADFLSEFNEPDYPFVPQIGVQWNDDVPYINPDGFRVVGAEPEMNGVWYVVKTPDFGEGLLFIGEKRFPMSMHEPEDSEQIVQFVQTEKIGNFTITKVAGYGNTLIEGVDDQGGVVAVSFFSNAGLSLKMKATLENASKMGDKYFKPAQIDAAPSTVTALVDRGLLKAQWFIEYPIGAYLMYKFVHKVTER